MWSATHESTSAAFGVGDSTVKHHIHSDGDNLKLAISAIVFTVFALSLGDALIKQISANFPLWQIFVVRSLIAIPVLVVVIKARHQSVSLKPVPSVYSIRSGDRGHLQ